MFRVHILIVTSILGLSFGSQTWAGMTGYALHLDDDALMLPGSAFDGLNDFTFEMWVKIDLIDDGGGALTNTFLSLANDETDNMVTWGQHPDGRVRIFLFGMPNGTTVGPPLCVNRWYHMALVRENTTIRSYVNGELIAEFEFDIGPLSVASLGAWVGQDQDCVAGCFQSAQAFMGELDEVRIWSAAIDPMDLRGRMHRSLEGTEQDLVAYWRLDEGNGQSAFDSSINGFDAVLGENDSPRGDSLDPAWVDSGAPIVAGDLISLEILGPPQVPENWQLAFSALAQFEGGPQIDVTELTLVTDWAFDPAKAGSFVAPGILATAEVGDTDLPGVMSASYTDATGTQTAEETVTVLPTGGAGSALSFAGGLVHLPASAFNDLEDFTFEAWAYFNDIGGDSDSNTILSLANAGNDDVLTLRQFEDGRARIFLEGMPNGLNFGSPMDVLVWHHIAVTRKGRHLRVSVDGVQEADFCYDAIPLAVDEGGAVLGQEQDCVGGCFDPSQAHSGSIDEVRLWNVARLECEVHETMFTPLTGDEPGLVGYWRFDEGRGQTLDDHSPFARSAFLGLDPDKVDEFDPQWIDSDAPLALSKAVCDGDANGDGIIDPLDYGYVASRFDCPVGSGDPDCDAADQNADGLVDPLDLGYVLSRFGDCP